MQSLTTQDNGQSRFERELDEVIHHFPQLKKVVGTDGYYLKGILDIPNDDGVTIGSFMVEIRSSDKFPRTFPILYETGGDLPNESDWHKYEDDACCITVLPDELLICKNGITVIEFIQKHAVAYLANQLHRKLTGKYKNGDYAHHVAGFRQYYTELLKTADMAMWKRYFDHVFNNKLIQSDRNAKCHCGSGIKFKHCHDVAFQKLKWLGKVMVAQHFLILLR